MANRLARPELKRSSKSFTIKEMNLEWVDQEATLADSSASEIVNRAIEYYKQHGPTATSEKEEQLRKTKEYDEILGTPSTVEELYSTD